MARNKHSSEKIQKITDISKDLFIQKGYDNTSVRDILTQAGISTGSLYNFFKNKEEILLSIYKEILDQIDRTTEEITCEIDDPLMKLSISIALKTIVFLENTYRKNIYFAAFRSSRVNEYINEHTADSIKAILSDARLFNDHEILIRSISINASINAVIEACIARDLQLEAHRVYSVLIQSALVQFDVPDSQIDSILRKTIKLLS